MYVFDIEADGLDNYTKIHCLVYYDLETEKYIEVTDYKAMVNFFLDKRKKIGHNILRYDKKVLEDILKVTIDRDTLVDTLGISWYLNTSSKRNSLEYYGEFYKIPKVEINDWETLSVEDYLKRCRRDVEINVRLWGDQLEHLRQIYDTENGLWNCINYLNFKLWCASLAESSGWKFNLPEAEKLLEKMKSEFANKKSRLEADLPPVKKMKIVNKPKHLTKKDGSLSEAGKRWYSYTRYHTSDEEVTQIQVFSKWEEPNAASPQQIKDWLTSLGWKPRTFKYNDKGTAVPQIMTPEKDVCPSITELQDKSEAIKELEGFSVLKHRIPYLESWIEEAKGTGYLKAEVAGLTNTLRFIHKTLVNIPGVDKMYGAELRGLLMADEGYELCGSDMVSLEDTTKQHYIYFYDPRYVEDMQKDGFDPHLDIAVLGKMMSKEDSLVYKQKEKELKPIRQRAKVTNYSCTYGAYPPRIARDAGISKDEAQVLFDTYWKRNWAILEIAKSLRVKTVRGVNWLFNPISRLWYHLKFEKDKFSTLNQGTGAYCFDVWLGFFLQDRPQLTAQFHDEHVIQIKKGYQNEVKEFLRNAIRQANDYLKLNVDLDISIQFGNNYSEIH